MKVFEIESFAKIVEIKKELNLLKTKSVKSGEDLERYIELKELLSIERLKFHASKELIDKISPLILEQSILEFKHNKSGEDFERYLELENEISTQKRIFALLSQ